MNRRLFLRAGLLTLLATATGAAAIQTTMLRRVDILRDGKMLRNQPFRALMKDDHCIVLGDPREDESAGLCCRVLSNPSPTVKNPDLIGCTVIYEGAVWPCVLSEDSAGQVKDDDAHRLSSMKIR